METIAFFGIPVVVGVAGCLFGMHMGALTAVLLTVVALLSTYLLTISSRAPTAASWVGLIHIILGVIFCIGLWVGFAIANIPWEKIVVIG